MNDEEQDVIEALYLRGLSAMSLAVRFDVKYVDVVELLGARGALRSDAKV